MSRWMHSASPLDVAHQIVDETSPLDLGDERYLAREVIRLNEVISALTEELAMARIDVAMAQRNALLSAADAAREHGRRNPMWQTVDGVMVSEAWLRARAKSIGL